MKWTFEGLNEYRISIEETTFDGFLASIKEITDDGDLSVLYETFPTYEEALEVMQCCLSEETYKLETEAKNKSRLARDINLYLEKYRSKRR